MLLEGYPFFLVARVQRALSSVSSCVQLKSDTGRHTRLGNLFSLFQSGINSRLQLRQDEDTSETGSQFLSEVRKEANSNQSTDPSIFQLIRERFLAGLPSERIR